MPIFDAHEVVLRKIQIFIWWLYIDSKIYYIKVHNKTIKMTDKVQLM